METDFSPPVEPTFEQQRDALQKGLGRAVMWAKAGLLNNDILLDACLNDQRFDKQCEPLRADWLWGMIQMTDNTGPFRGPVLTALANLEESTSTRQLCALACKYASLGDHIFRSRLYEIVRTTPVADRPRLGESEIVALDGDAAILFAAQIRGQRLQSVAAEWDDFGLVSDAIPIFDRRLIFLCEHGDPDVRTRAIVALEQNTHPEIRRYAFEQLQTESAHVAVGLLINNFEPGDEIGIIDLLCRPESDTDRLHRKCLDTITVLEKKAEADGVLLAMLAYFLTPCQICRSGASELLKKYGTAPSWLIEELRFDADAGD